jgi:hypothetical protein
MNFYQIIVNVGEPANRDAGLEPGGTKSQHQELSLREYRITDVLSLKVWATPSGGNKREQNSHFFDGVEVALVDE